MGIKTKYKVGDKVRVREDLRDGKDYYMKNSSSKWIAIGSMCRFAGKIVTISEAYCDRYRIEEYDCNWTDEMFEGLAKEIKLEELMDFRIKDYKVINNRVVIVEFADGDIQKAVCMPEDTFSEEQGLEVCIMKHICGGKAKYHKVLKEAQKQIEALKEAADKKEAEEKRIAKKQAKLAKVKEARAERRRAERIAEMREAYLSALQEYNGNTEKAIEVVEETTEVVENN